MRYLILIFLFACTKPAIDSTKNKEQVLVRIAAVNNDGSKTYTDIFRVNTGKVVVEFSVYSPSDLKEYAIEVSDDGKNFKQVKTLEPNKTDYKETIVVE